MRLAGFSNVGNNLFGQLGSPMMFTTRDNLTAQLWAYIAEIYAVFDILASRHPFQVFNIVVRSVIIFVIHFVALGGRPEKCDSHKSMQQKEGCASAVLPKPDMEVSPNPAWLQYLTSRCLPVCAINLATDTTLARNRKVVRVSIYSNWEPSFGRQHSYS